MVNAGLSPYEALVTGTVNPARFFETNEFGSVEVGKVADLLVVDANPLDAVANAPAAFMGSWSTAAGWIEPGWMSC